MMIDTLSMVAGLDAFSAATGTVGSMVIVVTVITSSSDAATWLGDSGNPRGHLRRTFREQFVKLFDGNAGCLAQYPHAGSRALFEVLAPHEANHLPVTI